MTEADWLAADDPYPLLQHLGPSANPRKLRLFAVACCRRIGERLNDVRSVIAIEVAERCADGLVGEPILKAAVEAARRAYENALNIHDGASFAPVWLSTQPFLTAAVSVATHCGQAVGAAEPAVQAGLVRDIFCNPFHPAPALDPAWLRWRDATIPRLAQQMYDARDFASMPILADALEEAGCTSASILDHCRGPGPHVRGCWVVDLILGKE